MIRLLLLSLLLVGCTSAPPLPVPPAPDNALSTQGLAWRYARLQFHWNADNRPDWHLDPLAANEIYAPLLQRYRARIPLWRFHRRAAQDLAGHQLSLIIYTDDATAKALMRDLAADPLVAQLKQRGQLRKLLLETTVPAKRRELAATSDPNWSPDLQRSWPYFAMGVSQSWLALLREQLPAAFPSDFDSLINQYRSINEQLNQRWYAQGGHAYLHHLNALFGYQPVKVPLPGVDEARF